MKRSYVELVVESDELTVAAKINDRLDVMQEQHGWEVQSITVNVTPGVPRIDANGFSNTVQTVYVGTIHYVRDV